MAFVLNVAVGALIVKSRIQNQTAAVTITDVEYALSAASVVTVLLVMAADLFVITCMRSRYTALGVLCVLHSVMNLIYDIYILSFGVGAVVPEWIFNFSIAVLVTIPIYTIINCITCCGAKYCGHYYEGDNIEGLDYCHRMGGGDGRA